MESEILSGLIAGGPLAGVLGYAVWTLYAWVRQLEAELRSARAQHRADLLAILTQGGEEEEEEGT